MDTRHEADAAAVVEAAELRARAARIRQRSRLLIEELGPDHALVAEALTRARHLEARANGVAIHLP